MKARRLCLKQEERNSFLSIENLRKSRLESEPGSGCFYFRVH